MPRSSSTIPWLINIIFMLWQGADSHSKLGCGTDRITEYEAFAAMAGKQVVTVAVAQYGLLRNNCSAYIYERLFAQLPTSEKYVYVVDHFIHSNELFAGHETGKYRMKVAGGDPNKAPIDPYIFEDFPECRFATTPQEMVDLAVEPQLAATCGKYGDAWGDKTCGVTLNYLRGLYSQGRVHEMIVAHEHTTKRKYDIVVLMRPDVMFTRQLNVKYFDATADGLLSKPQKSILFTPNWAMWSGANDRFMLGARDGVMHTLQRLDYTAHWCANVSKGPLHSEHFLFWLLNNYTKWAGTELKTADGAPKLVEVQAVHAFFFRRLRATAALVGTQYLRQCGTWASPGSKNRCPAETSHRTHADSIGFCSKHDVDRMMQEWTPLVDVLSLAHTEEQLTLSKVWSSSQKKWISTT